MRCSRVPDASVVEWIRCKYVPASRVDVRGVAVGRLQRLFRWGEMGLPPFAIHRLVHRSVRCGIKELRIACPKFGKRQRSPSRATVSREPSNRVFGPVGTVG